METRISIFSFSAAVIIMIAKWLAAKADQKGNVYIPTARQIIQYGKKTIQNIKKKRRIF